MYEGRLKEKVIQEMKERRKHLPPFVKSPAPDVDALAAADIAVDDLQLGADHEELPTLLGVTYFGMTAAVTVIHVLENEVSVKFGERSILSCVVFGFPGNIFKNTSAGFTQMEN